MDGLDETTPVAVNARTGVPGWYWVAAVAALLWTLMGCYSYLAQVGMDAADVAALPQEQQDLWTAMPAWLTGVFAVAVWSALTGAVGLLLRKAWAAPLFMVSLAAVIVQFGSLFLVTDYLAVMGNSAALFPLCIAIIGVLLVWFSALARRRGWID